MGMIVLFAVIGAVVALIPTASAVLIPLEAFMVYRIAHKHNAFDLVPFLVTVSAVVAFSVSLKGIATIMHVIPVIGQIANSLVAATFILVLGVIANQFYSSRAK